MRKFVYNGCAFLIFLGLLAFAFFAGAEVVPPKIEYEVVTVEEQVTVPCPTSIPMPTCTPVVKTLEGKECPVCPTPIPPKVEHYVPAFIHSQSYDRNDVVVHDIASVDRGLPRSLGVLGDGTPVNVLIVREYSCFITFKAPWGNKGWVCCGELTDKKKGDD